MKNIFRTISMSAAVILMLQGCKSEKIEYVTTDRPVRRCCRLSFDGCIRPPVAYYAEEITSSSVDPVSVTRAGKDFNSTTEASGDYVIRIRNIKTSEEQKMTYAEFKQAGDKQIP